MMPIIKPPALKMGDTIGIVVPAGPVNRERIDRAIARIEARGFRTKTYGDIYRANGYLAGDDATRGGEFMPAFADPETSAVWCARGGYGVMRFFDRIDFDAVRRNPKIFVGFSDITALHLAIHQRTGLVTFHGPNLQDGFGKPEEPPAENETVLWSLLSPHTEQPSELAYSAQSLRESGSSLRAIRGGTATARLTGGNLAVISGLMGTPYEIETTGRILFLEDVSERVYRLDRYLSQLRLAGKLENLAGVLLGTFTPDEGDDADYQREIARLCDEFFSPLGVPVLAGFPAGHGQYNLVLPIGAQIELDADAAQVTLLENCVASH
jgi:muramoyltetrapeptide carboxypeptidase